ncbi:MAG: sigma-54 dependent transcriptional regulator [Burkholderiales bacterium]|nr:sigma-54-dependent Fis family transcriptional regulator [Burkholderiales bacterium]MCJ7837732.1 sigma-54 dependent transcriptional regulator [Burkholderiales bacterium]
MEDFTKLNLVGQAPAFLCVLRLIRKFSACDATVLVQGETGTGKELAARAIHYLGARRSHPFIPVNCGALPDSLIENELFGHVRGAFTDARESQSGLIATAEGGTLFLDEIEALSPKGQVVLLRFLQDRAYKPLGGKTQTSGDVRVIVASNADVAHLVRTGLFREDLLYRLTILSLRMPALRERTGDPTALARHFIGRFARQYARPECELDSESMDFLCDYDWPGNVRELENLIHREFLMAEESTLRIAASNLGLRFSTASEKPTFERRIPFELGFRRAKALVVAEFEREFIHRALSNCQGNVSAAARLIGKERRAMGKLLRKHNIDRSTFN